MNEELIMSLGSPVEDLEFVYLLRSRLHSLLKLHRNPEMFPGSQPVSFEKRHLDQLEREDYYVCEKSDGMRYLLYFAIPPTGPVAFLIDRNYNFRALDHLTLPTRDLKGFQEETLIDGELVWDEEKGELVYYIFDGIMFMARNLCGMDLNGRLQVVQNDVISPYNSRESKKIQIQLAESNNEKNIIISEDNENNYLRQSFPFKMKMKQMWKPYGLRELFERIIPAQGHENDGLIFTPMRDAYQAGTCHRLLKWKPSDMNSIDFLVFGKELHIATQGRTHFYREFEPSEDEQLMKFIQENVTNRTDDSDCVNEFLNGKIVEFRLDPVKDRWSFMRLRADKRLPNDSKTVEKVLQSIRDNVSKKDLMDREAVIRANWKMREKKEMTGVSALPSRNSNSNSNANANANVNLPIKKSTTNNASSNGLFSTGNIIKDIKPRSQIINSSSTISPPFKYPLNLRTEAAKSSVYEYADGWISDCDSEANSVAVAVAVAVAGDGDGDGAVACCSEDIGKDQEVCDELDYNFKDESEINSINESCRRKSKRIKL